MAAADDLLALNGAPSQLDRARAAPLPARVRVDGRSLADLLAFAADYGTLIKFYNLADQADGDWSVFFLGDPSVSLALSVSLDTADIQAELDRLLEELRGSTSLEARADRVHVALTVIRRLARILTRGRTDAVDIEQALAGLGASDRPDLLAAPARRLALHLGGSPLEHRLRNDRADWFPQLLDHLETLGVAMVAALDQARPEALAALEASLNDHSHPPQSGLYDAFAKLLGYAQESINSFPERLVQFYRSEILRQTSRPGIPDTVCLSFTPAKGVARAELPRGTQFLAGTDADGENIAYAIDSALTVDAASVAALRTLTVTSESTGGPGRPIPAQVLSGTVALAGKAPEIAAPFPLFGATSTGTSGVLTTAKATLGFAIASPTLMLTGGTRAVAIGLTIAPASLAAVTATLEQLGAAAGGLAPTDVFVRLLEAAFALRYSTAGGWVDIPGYQVTPPTADYPLFALSFVLDTDADPFVALMTEPAAAGAAPPDEGSAIPDPATPTLVASLRQEPVTLGAGGSTISVYPYSLLSKLMLSALSVAVEVVGLESLEASTPGGPVDTSQPFLVFGSPPVQHATLDIGSPELFAKRLDGFRLTVEWFGLPVTTTGFQGYYKAYVIDADGKTVPPGSQFDNRSFTARLEVFNPGRWSLSDTAQYLFQTAPHDPVPSPDGALRPETLLVGSVESRQPPAYYDPGSSAVRLRLHEPDTAFGNVLYAANVMAASVRLTAAASACAQQCGQSDGTGQAGGALGPLIAANANAPDEALDWSVGAAVQRAVANLDGAALKAIEDAIAASDAAPETKEEWRESLSATLGRPRPALFWRLIRCCVRAPDFVAVHGKLDDWLAAHAASIAPTETALLARARALLRAASRVLEVRDKAAGQPATVSRPVVAAGLRAVQALLAEDQGTGANDCIQECMNGTDLLGFPNQPWLPMAASLSVDYSAATAIPPTATAESVAPATLFHLLPFDGVETVAWSEGTVPLLTQIDFAGALFVGLSDPAGQLTLLFRLAPPASGWPTDTTRVSWAQAVGETDWTALTPLRDSTKDLHRTGIVSLTLAEPAGQLPWLRVSVPGDAAAFPMLAGLTTNAAMASWVGPGGAEKLGTPLAAGTITKPAAPLPDIGSIEQPMPSSGGAPAETGAGLEEWLAERLRHKDRAIQPWDYSNLLLAAFPSLWQVAVVPASDGGLGPAPGNVWVVPVPGPQSPDIADPTIPSNDSTMLGDIASYLAGRISPFIQLTVANPPYRRITVHADLLFRDSDSVEANIERLNDELIQFLSPWPPLTLPPRPADYYTRKEVAHFVRHRPYVRAIRSLWLTPDTAGLAPGWHYLTSASSHCLRGKAQPETEPGLQPLLSLPRTAPAATGHAT